MSVTIKFTISDAQYEELLSQASNSNPKMSVQDYIRNELFEEFAKFTPYKAINLALKRYRKGETFTVGDLFQEGFKLPNGEAGQFGKQFYRLVRSEYNGQIGFTGNLNSKRQAIYVILQDGIK